MAESAIALFFFLPTEGQVGIIISAKGSLNVHLSHGSGIAIPAGPGTQPAGHGGPLGGLPPVAGTAAILSKSQVGGQVTPDGSVSGTHLQPGAQIF